MLVRLNETFLPYPRLSITKTPIILRMTNGHPYITFYQQFSLYTTTKPRIITMIKKLTGEQDGFVLLTDNTSYIIAIAPSGHPEHLY